MAQTLKNLPAMRETWVQFLSRDDPLEKEMAAPCSILAWRIPWTKEPGGATVYGVAKSWTLNTFLIWRWKTLPHTIRFSLPGFTEH